MKKSAISILGAGSWGTAVAIHIASAGIPVVLWGRNPEHVREMQASRCNTRFLPDVKFPETLKPIADFDEAVQQAERILIAVPSHAFMDILARLQKPKQGLSWLTKGLDPLTNHFLSDKVAALWGETFPISLISGPSFAGEVARGLPTALVLAGNDASHLKSIHALLHHGATRVYDSSDIIGVQWCGAVKNVIAIACGISDGLRYGANAKAALITRGLAEMSRIGTHLGGKQETFMGLAGVGDLVLTCTDNQSRNRRFGLGIGEGASCLDAEQQIGQVVEGKYNAAQVCALAAELHIEMPICQQVDALLKGLVTAEQAAYNLMNRPARGE